MSKQIVLALLIMLGVIGIFGFVKYSQVSSLIKKMKSKKHPSVAVTTIVVKKEIWPYKLSSIGTIKAVNGSMLSSEASGRVSAVNFSSGDVVEKGQVLVELDSGVENAELLALQSKLTLETLNAKRQKALRKKGANSESDLDEALANLRTMEANVLKLKEIIRRRKIIAPFSGVTGILKVDVGETIASGTPVVSLQNFSKLHVNFSLPQQDISELKIGNIIELSFDAFKGEVFRGTLSAINSSVDIETRNIELQGVLENKDNKLRPGMFANVRVLLDKKNEVLSIPSTSISYAPYGNTVYLVKRKKSKGEDSETTYVSHLPVTLGRKYGDRISVLSGLKEGDEIVSAGTFRLKNNTSIFINNKVKPQNELNPTPENM